MIPAESLAAFAVEYGSLIPVVVGPEGANFIQTLSRHLFEKHQDEWGRQVIMVPSMMTIMLTLKIFMQTSQDSSIGESVNFMRHLIHVATGFHVTDERLKEQLTDLPMSVWEDRAVLFDQLLAFLQTMRDVIEERPPFVPKLPGAAAI